MTAIVIDGEEVMTQDELDTLARLRWREFRKAANDEWLALFDKDGSIAQFTQRPGYQNGMRGLEEMEAGRS